MDNGNLAENMGLENSSRRDTLISVGFIRIYFLDKVSSYILMRMEITILLSSVNLRMGLKMEKENIYQIKELIKVIGQMERELIKMKRVQG